MIALLGLLFYASGAALFSFAVYGMLRWLGSTCPPLLYILGTLALPAHLLPLFIVATVCLGNSRLDWVLVAIFGSVLSIWLASLTTATLIVRRATEGRATRCGAFLLCALYWAVTLPVTLYLSAYWGWLNAFAINWMKLWKIVGVGDELWVYVLGAFLCWIFPFGAPMMELAILNLRRLSRAATSGSFA